MAGIETSSEEVKNYAQTIFCLISCFTVILPMYVAFMKLRGNYKTVMLIYALTGIFTFMYHLTDIPGVHEEIIFRKPFFYFFERHCTTLCICYTLLRISDFEPEIIHLFSTAIGLASAVRLKHAPDKKETIWIPLTSAVIPLLYSYGLRTYKDKKIFPAAYVWKQCLIPGFCLAILALVLKFVVEYSKVAHGFYHILLACSMSTLLMSTQTRNAVLAAAAKENKRQINNDQQVNWGAFNTLWKVFSFGKLFRKVVIGR